MALYSAKTRIAAPGAAGTILELRPVGRPAALRLLKVTAETAVAAGTGLSLFRSTNVPAGGTLITGQPLDSGKGAPASSSGIVVTGWTTAATVGTQAIDGGWLGGVVGAVVPMGYGYGEELMAGYDTAAVSTLRSLILQVTAAGPAMTLEAVWDE